MPQSRTIPNRLVRITPSAFIGSLSVLNECAALCAEPGYLDAPPAGINCASGFVRFGADGNLQLARKPGGLAEEPLRGGSVRGAAQEAASSAGQMIEWAGSAFIGNRTTRQPQLAWPGDPIGRQVLPKPTSPTSFGGLHREAQRLKQTGSGRPCQARRGTPRPGIGIRGIFAG